MMATVQPMIGAHEAVNGLVHCTVHLSLCPDTKGIGGQVTVQENSPGGPGGRIRCLIMCVYVVHACVFMWGCV